jgi:hypothetical protein
LIWNEGAVRAGMIAPNCMPHWSEEMYYDLLAMWDTTTEIVAATYDCEVIFSVEEQIERAKRMADRFPWLTVNILLKPERQNSQIEVRDILPFTDRLAVFSVIGVTEKELGSSMGRRLICLAELRDSLTAAGLHTPIHVFGGLDPLMTPLYFMAGADIFDGLSWLRYAFTSTGSQYDQAHLSLTQPTDNFESAFALQRLTNLEHLVQLQNSMALLADGASVLDAFGGSGERIQKAWEQAWSAK